MKEAGLTTADVDFSDWEELQKINEELSSLPSATSSKNLDHGDQASGYRSVSTHSCCPAVDATLSLNTPTFGHVGPAEWIRDGHSRLQGALTEGM